MGWNKADVLNSEQCKRETELPFNNAEAGEGCLVSGFLKVNKVAGNFHIAHGESIIRDGRHIHQFNPKEAPSYNVSHTIHSITFGLKYPNMPHSPLNGGNIFVHSTIRLNFSSFSLHIFH